MLGVGYAKCVKFGGCSRIAREAERDGGEDLKENEYNFRPKALHLSFDDD